MRKSSHSRLNKGLNSKFPESQWNQQTPEMLDQENKDEDIGLNKNETNHA